MATREKAMEQDGKTKAADLPARKVEKAEQVKGGGQRRQDIIAI